MEPTEIGEFSEKMKESGESGLLMRDSLMISVLAVLVAIVTVMGHRTHTQAVLLQSREGDRWSEYESRKVRATETQLSAEALALQPYSGSPAAQGKLNEYKANLAKWKSETDADAVAAKEFGEEVDLAERAASRWDLSEALLEIAVVLASITLLTKHWRYAVAGVAIGLVGAGIGVAALLVK